MPNMTGRPGCRTADNGNEWGKFRVVPRSHLCFSCFVFCFLRVEREELFDYQGRAGIISIVRWILRPVIFGVGFVFLHTSAIQGGFVFVFCSRPAGLQGKGETRGPI